MKRHYQDPERYYRHRNHKGDKLWFGFAVVLLGVYLLLKKLHIFYFDWHTFWPLILIAVGVMIGIQKKFRNNAWWILILIGLAYSIPEFEISPGVWSSSLMFPVALIVGGVIIALRSQKKNQCADNTQVVTSTENTLNIDVTFGGRKEIVTSKEFRGGDVSATFAGCEINMIQADSTTQPMVLNLKVSFGGVEIIVPSHWELQNEIDPTFGSVEDHRSLRTPDSGENKKVLILKGSCNFGSIEIKSY